ncbi:MAG: alpha-amylase family glycosyl hydrolase [Tissierellia bacterium]|nr:alpha-amylase family glycosyl hydrolase [Tissierellia bacterium]
MNKLFCPAIGITSMDLLIYHGSEGNTYSRFPMKKEKEGFFISPNPLKPGDYYTFLLDDRYEITDPQCTETDVYGIRSRYAQESEPRKRIFEPSDDLVIYEVHVKDFSIDPEGGFQYPGTFAAFSENLDNIGRSHIKDLGITMVHLLPPTDFVTMTGDPLAYLEEDNYNWGYDPEHFRVLHPGYGTSPENPKKTKCECKKMIDSLHKDGIGVIFDIVFNHTYRTKDSNLYLLSQGNYYRKTKKGEIANGSGVGNELATEHPHIQKLLLDTLEYWVREFQVDGFRFDLMALLDREFLIEAKKRLEKINPNIFLYGEPWSALPDSMPEHLRWSPKEDLGFYIYDDVFRDAVRGNNFGFGGFLGGDFQEGDKILQALLYPSKKHLYYLNCHDDYILWDQLKKFGLGNDELLSRKYKLGMSLLALARGPILMAGGNEWQKGKGGLKNTYQGPASVNALHWSEKWHHYGTYQYIKDLLKFRKEKLLRGKEVEGKVLENKDGFLLYGLYGEKTMYVAINGRNEDIIFQPEKYGIKDVYRVFSEEGESKVPCFSEEKIENNSILIFET